MLDLYIQKGAQKLRCGYTTGSCATAASKAAAYMLLSEAMIDSVDIMTPKGVALSLEVLEIEKTTSSVKCAIKKDSGDDYDITNGVLVYSKVSLTSDGINIDGGDGIGRVTKEGLDQPVGNAAINSTPRKMIIDALNGVAEEFDYKGGFDVVISIPKGVEIAHKTFNARMGIIGGISVIGTSGIVEPMSNSAIIETIRVESKIRKAEGRKNLLLTIGNYSSRYVQSLMPVAFDKSITCSNFIGDAIDIAMEQGFESVLIVGHCGKLVKLGAGIMNTHSSYADGRMDVITSCGVSAGVDSSVLKEIYSCITVDSAFEKIRSYDEKAFNKMLDILKERVQNYLELRVRDSIKIGAVMFSDKLDITIKTNTADDIISRIIGEENG